MEVVLILLGLFVRSLYLLIHCFLSLFVGLGSSCSNALFHQCSKVRILEWFGGTEWSQGFVSSDFLMFFILQDPKLPSKFLFPSPPNCRKVFLLSFVPFCFPSSSSLQRLPLEIVHTYKFSFVRPYLDLIILYS